MSAVVENTPSGPVWTLQLNEYQRNNLLFLLNCVGYPDDERLIVEPMNLLNTGDWLGEVVQKLENPGSERDLHRGMVAHRANVTRDELKTRIAMWR